MKASVAGIRECCVEILQSKHTEFRLVIAAARAVEADAVFNMKIAERKQQRTPAPAPFLQWIEAYEAVHDRVLETYRDYSNDQQGHGDAMLAALGEMTVLRETTFPS